MMNNLNRSKGESAKGQPFKPKWHNYLFLAFLIGMAFPAAAQVTAPPETFENAIPGATYFISNSTGATSNTQFDLTGGTVTNLQGGGWNNQGNMADNQFLQSTGTSLQIAGDQNAAFQVSGFYLLPIDANGAPVSPALFTITGTLKGVTQFSQNTLAFAPNGVDNNYAFINMANINNNDYSHIPIDALTISFAGFTDGVASFRVDFFGWTPQPNATINCASDDSNYAYAKNGSFVSITVGSTSGAFQSITGTLGSQTLNFSSPSGFIWNSGATFDSTTPQGPIGYDIILTDPYGNTNELVSNNAATGLVTFDNIKPVLQVTQPSVTYVNAVTPLTYTATWTDTNLNPASTQLTPGDVQINTTGTVAVGYVGVSNPVIGTSTIALTSVMGDGTVNITLPSNKVQDYAGNFSAGFTSNTLLVDNTPPKATISAPSVDSVGNDGSAYVTYKVTYADAHFNTSNLTTAGITLNATGTAAGTVNVSGADTSYVVTIYNITGIGKLGISLGAAHAFDFAGNPDDGAGPSANFIVSSTTAALSTTSQIVTNQTSLSYLLTFPVPVTGLTASNFVVTSSYPNAAISGITPVSGTNNTQYGINITSDSSPIDGIDSLTLINDSGLSVRLSGLPVAGNAYHILLSPFTVKVTGVIPPGDTSGYIKAGANVGVYLASNRPVKYIAGRAGGDANGIGINLSSNDSDSTEATFTLTESGLEGPVDYDLTLTDQFGNEATLAGNLGVIYDSTPPTEAVISGGYHAGGTVDFEVLLSDRYLDTTNSILTPGDIVIERGNTVSFDQVTISGSGSTRTVELTRVQGEGGLYITVGGFAVDLAGNRANKPARSPQITINYTPPQCFISEPSAASVSGNGTNSVSYTVNYSSTNFASSSLADTSIALNTTGTATGTINVTGAGTSYTVTITNITGAGTLGISVAGGNAVAQNGESDLGAGPSDTFNVVSADAALSGLSLSNAPLSPGFSSTTTSYTAAVGNGLTGINITPITDDPNATVTINSTAATSGSATAVPLVVGNNNIVIVVTAADGVTTQTYNIAISEAQSQNNTLSLIRTSAGLALATVVPASMTENVPNAVSSITVSPTVTDATATITVNGASVTSGTASAGILLTAGTNTITIIVTAQDTRTKTYTLTVNRALSANNNLSGLAVTNGKLSPAFGTPAYYQDFLGNGVPLSITPTVADATATLTINGVAATSGSATAVPLIVGNNTVTIVVTAQNGNTKTYTVMVNEARSANNTLMTLKTSGGLAVGQVVPTTLTESVPNTTSSITVTPTMVNKAATVAVNGTPVASGSPSGAIALSVGANTITIIGTAQNGSSLTYTLTVTRAPSSSLSNLTATAGALNIPFASSTTGYIIYAPNGVTGTTITPTTIDPNATIKVNGSTVTSGSASQAIPLPVGNSTITIAVTAAGNSSTTTYTVSVNRARSSNNALLTYKTSAGLAKGVPVPTTLTESVVNAASTINITPTVEDATATVTINGAAVNSGSPSPAIALSVGQNTITTVVTAQNGATQTYTLTVTRAMASANTVYQPAGVGVQNFEPLTFDDGINVHQGISPNGDGINDYLQIDNITQYPDNNLKIMNRNGQLVYEAKGYDNATKTFDGHSNKTGQMQLPGTYFYSLDYTVDGVIKHKTGFLVLKY